MRAIILAVLVFTALAFLPLALPAERGDHGFRAPTQEFKVKPGVFMIQKDQGRMPRNTFKPTPRTFAPTRGSLPEPGAFKVRPGSFTINEGDFQGRGDFRTKPGVYYIGNGFLDRK